MGDAFWRAFAVTAFAVVLVLGALAYRSLRVRLEELRAAMLALAALIASSSEQARTNLEATKPSVSAKASNSDDEPPSAPPVSSRPVTEVVADKGYRKAELLRDLKQARYRTYISAPNKSGDYRWTDSGGIYTEQTYRGNRARVRRDKGRALMRRRRAALPHQGPSRILP